MGKSDIPTFDHTWSPALGCTFHDNGVCRDGMKCYAYSLFHRFAEKWPVVNNGFQPQWVEAWFNKPFPREQSRIFITAMSDPADWDDACWTAIMGRIGISNRERNLKRLGLHQFFLLSKRPYEAYHGRTFPDNCYCGITVTNQKTLDDRFFNLGFELQNSYLYIEPLLGKIYDLKVAKFKSLKWVVVGGETGNKNGTIDMANVVWLYIIAKKYGVPFYFKGVGGCKKITSINGWDWVLDDFNNCPREFIPFAISAMRMVIK